MPIPAPSADLYCHIFSQLLHFAGRPGAQNLGIYPPSRRLDPIQRRLVSVYLPVLQHV